MPRPVVWIVNHYAPAPVAGENVAGRHLMLGRELVRRGYRVVILACALDQRDGRRQRHLDAGQPYKDIFEGELTCRMLRGLPFTGMAGRLLGMAHFEQMVLRFAKGLPRPALVIGSSVHLFAAHAGLLLARRFGARFVFEIRDIWPATIADLKPWARFNPAYWALRELEKHLYRQADRVISLLPLGREHVRRSGGDPAGVFYLPNMVDLAPYVSADYPHVAGGDGFTVLYLGSVTQVYGLEHLVGAARRILATSPGIRFRVVGGGAALADMKRAASGLANIEFVAPVPRERVPAEYARAHAAVASFRRLPVVSQYGMSMNKVYECLGARRPLVFAVDAPCDPVSAARAGVCCEPESADALVAAIMKLAQMSVHDRVEMGRRGHAFVRSRYSRDAVGARFSAFVEEVLADRPPGTLVDPRELSSEAA